ncbi:MAG: response regulator [Burkholderiaceae bacterium]|nr:response regulator [Sulfuritalea sp.]MCF8176468.1 response regulator [Burkholderiaceae bacterium]
MWRDTIERGSKTESDMLEGEIAQQTVRAGSFFSAVSTGLFAAVYALGGPLEFVAPHLVACVLLGIIAGAPTGSTTVRIYLAVTIGLLLFGYQLLLLGRIDNGITLWFLVPFVAAMMLGMTRLALFSAVLTLIEVIGAVVAARVGWLQPRVLMPDPGLIMLLSLIGVMTLCGIFALITQRARAGLMKDVATRTQALELALEDTDRARNAAIEAARAKEQFFANLTHEIRTPLTGIAGTAELLSQTELSTAQLPLAKALKASTLNLAELVNAMLDHAKMRAGYIAVECAPVNLRDFVRDLEDFFSVRSADKKLAFVVSVDSDTPDWIETDGIRLRQVVTNLLSNAVKFTANGSIDLKMHCTDGAGAGAGEEKRLIIEVTDTGMGIPPEKINFIFEPFVQGDASISRTHGGTGLGLAIALELAKLLDGSLRVESQPEKGSTFTLEIPARIVDSLEHPAAATTAASTPQRAVVADGGSLRVLLAEDNKVNLLVATTMLEHLGASVVEAGNGLEAVARATEGGHHVIFMDLQMPEMDGITATREIRRIERESGRIPVPIFAMTGNSRDDYGAACIEAGMSGFLMKPVTLDQLRIALAEVSEPG